MTDRNSLADAIILDVAELPDRTSPEDEPDMMLVTAEELRAIIARNLPADRYGEGIEAAAKVCDTLADAISNWSATSGADRERRLAYINAAEQIRKLRD